MSERSYFVDLIKLVILILIFGHHARIMPGASTAYVSFFSRGQFVNELVLILAVFFFAQKLPRSSEVKLSMAKRKARVLTSALARLYAVYLPVLLILLITKLIPFDRSLPFFFLTQNYSSDLRFWFISWAFCALAHGFALVTLLALNPRRGVFIWIFILVLAFAVRFFLARDLSDISYHDYIFQVYPGTGFNLLSILAGFALSDFKNWAELKNRTIEHPFALFALVLAILSFLNWSPYFADYEHLNEARKSAFDSLVLYGLNVVLSCVLIFAAIRIQVPQHLRLLQSLVRFAGRSFFEFFLVHVFVIQIVFALGLRLLANRDVGLDTFWILWIVGLAAAFALTWPLSFIRFYVRRLQLSV